MNHDEWARLSREYGGSVSMWHPPPSGGRLQLLIPPEQLRYQEWYMSTDLSYWEGYPSGVTDGRIFTGRDDLFNLEMME